jgi:hypothetical protein
MLYETRQAKRELGGSGDKKTPEGALRNSQRLPTPSRQEIMTPNKSVAIRRTGW